MTHALVAPPAVRQFAALEPTVDAALSCAAGALSAMAGLDVLITSSSIELARLPELPRAVGGADDAAVGVYVGMAREGSGYLLLLLDEPMARVLAALLLGDDPSTIDLADELPVSALAEAGNVTCSAFLNAIADATGLRLEATPPIVANDMRGALVDPVLATIAAVSDEALVIGTRFAPCGTAGASMPTADARLVVLPTRETHARILSRLAGPSAERLAFQVA